MTTLANLIKRNRQRAVRRCYIKRRLYADGTFEASWQRVDNYNNKDRVISWGSGAWEVNNEPGQIPSFEATSLTMVFDNNDGNFNIESDTNSFWHDSFTYIRPLSKLKIEIAYLDDDGSEVGTADSFEGIIEKPEIKGDGTVRISVLSYITILQQYDISDLSLAGSAPVSTTVNAIMNQSKITNFIPYVASNPDQNVTVDRTLLTGTYWKVIKDLAFKSNSIPVLIGSVFNFKVRTVGVSSAYDFIGTGAGSEDDIFEILSYDDEGRDRVRVFWKNSESGASETATSTNSVLLTKYLGSPQEIDLTVLTSSSQKQDVLDAQLAEWENPKPVLEVSTRFLANLVDPLDKVTFRILGRFNRSETGDGGYWGSGTWGEGSRWGRLEGGINILSGVNWMATKVENNFDEWKSTIKAERVV